jgi:hypothetical protein
MYSSLAAPGRLRLTAALGAAAALASAVLALGSTPAHAALLSTGACDNAALSQPFGAWGDSNPYKQVPGGDFEGTLSGWTLRGDSHVVSGGGPLRNGAGHSLSLSAGSWVQTPKTCVNTSYPTFRLFSSGSQATSTILVQAVYAVPLLGDVPVPVGAVTLNPGWSPTLPMLTASTVTGVLSGGTAQVALRFTQLVGTSRIDDVYIDPRMR